MKSLPTIPGDVTVRVGCVEQPRTRLPQTRKEDQTVWHNLFLSLLLTYLIIQSQTTTQNETQLFEIIEQFRYIYTILEEKLNCVLYQQLFFFFVILF